MNVFDYYDLEGNNGCLECWFLITNLFLMYSTKKKKTSNEYIYYIASALKRKYIK